MKRLEDGIDLHILDLNPGQELLDQYRSWLDEIERARADRFVFEKVRRTFTAAHGALRSVLASYSADERFLSRLGAEQLQIECDSLGKPYWKNGAGISFNLSHSGQWGLLAVDRQGRSLGADLEQMREGSNFHQLSQRFFAAEENAYLAMVPEVEFVRRFMQIWTRKEAYVKAVGTGLRTPLDSFIVPCGDCPVLTPVRLAGFSEPASRVLVREVEVVEGYIGALALEVSQGRACQTH